MKYFIAIMLLASSAFSCEKCLQDMENSLDVMKYYNDFSETEQWKTYTNGVIWGLQMSCKIYEINHLQDQQ